MKFSTKIKKWLAAFDLKFLDPSEEQEYNEVRIKVIKDFALVSFSFFNYLISFSLIANLFLCSMYF